MKRKSPNLSIHWVEFEKEKIKFLGSTKVQKEIALHASIDNPNGAFRNLDYSSTYLKYRRMNKVINKFVNDFENLEKILGFKKNRIAEHLYEVKVAFEEAVKNLDTWSAAAPPPEALSSNKTGPKIYPEFLILWIVKAIESAKGDKAKLLTLIEFFRPKGEFDLWLQKHSDGFWRGPSKNTYPKDEATDDNWEVDRSWINGVKKNQSKNLKKR